MKICGFYNSLENKYTQFLKKVEDFLYELKLDHHTVYLGDDSNFDLLKDKQNVKNYVALSESFSMKHVNMETATRVTETSETCIDHILTISIFYRDSTKIVELDITDHCAVRHVTNYTYELGVTPGF